MSRVHKPGTFVNTVKYPPHVLNPSKMIRIHQDGEDYHKARTLSAWLFMKYDMKYSTFKNKSKSRRGALREEYTEDTRRF